jgi:hypothetical protein
MRRIMSDWRASAASIYPKGLCCHSDRRYEREEQI